MFELWTAWGFVRDYWPWVLGAAIAVVGMLAWAYVTRSLKVAVEALGAIALALTASQIYRRGAASEKGRQDAANDKTAERTQEVQARVDGMTDEEVRQRLDQWIPPEEKKP